MSRDRSPCFLGLDSGTQSAKAGIWDAHGTRLAQASRSLSVQTPAEGWAEQDPEQWWESAREAIAEAVSRVDASRIAAMGVSFQRESFALLDADGRAVRPAVLWLDIRSSAEVEEAARRLGARAYHERTGKPLDVTSVLPRMLWLARHEPAAVARAARWVDVGSYLLERLTGTSVTCVAGADTTGLVDLDSRLWSPERLAACGLDRLRMPGLIEPGSVAAGLTPQAARATGLEPGLPVAAGGGDGQCLSVGLGAAPGKGFTLTLGTSAILGLPRMAPSISSLYRTLVAARPDRQYLLESVIQSGTYIVKWFQDTFPGGPPSSGSPSAGDGESLLERIPRGSDGLVTVPHWWGVRFPESLPEARGATLGWSHRHSRAHFLRSILEGVAFELRTLAEEYRAAFPGEPLARISACGGGARSRAWLHILCEAMAMPILLTDEPEPAARGAAMLSAVGVGAFRHIDAAAAAMVREKETVVPDPAGVSRYEQLYRGSYLPLRKAALRLFAGRGPTKDPAGG